MSIFNLQLKYSYSTDLHQRRVRAGDAAKRGYRLAWPVWFAIMRYDAVKTAQVCHRRRLQKYRLHILQSVVTNKASTSTLI